LFSEIEDSLSYNTIEERKEVILVRQIFHLLCDIDARLKNAFITLKH